MSTAHPIITGCVGPMLGKNEDVKIRTFGNNLCFFVCVFLCDLGRLLKTCDDGYELGEEKNSPRFHDCLKMYSSMRSNHGMDNSVMQQMHFILNLHTAAVKCRLIQKPPFLLSLPLFSMITIQLSLLSIQKILLDKN